MNTKFNYEQLETLIENNSTKWFWKKKKKKKMMAKFQRRQSKFNEICVWVQKKFREKIFIFQF